MREKRSTLRTIRPWVLIVVFGVVATVLSAWISAVVVPIGSRPHHSYGNTPWMEPVPTDWPANGPGVTYLVQKLSMTPGIPPRSSRLRFRQGLADGVSVGPAGVTFLSDDPRYVLDTVSCGWPFNTMVHLGPDDARAPASNAMVRLYHSGIPVSGKGTAGYRALPIRPIWGEFGLSVLMWSSILLLLWQGWSVSIWNKRRKWCRDGRCHGCGYAIEDLATCPECGWSPVDHAAA